LQLDGSAHSLISKIALTSNGVILEEITDYDEKMIMHFDLNYSCAERSMRKENEGFGDNEWGTNETIIPGIKRLEEAFEGEEVTAEQSANTLITHQLEVHPDLIETWSEVIDGKLSPFPFTPANLNKFKNKRKFRVPIMLKLFGLGQGVENYKLLPMELFGLCGLHITLNPHAFFVPKERSKFNYFNSSLNKEETQIWAGTDWGYADKRDYKIIKCTLHTEQYHYSDEFTQRFVNNVKNGKFMTDYIALEREDENWFYPNSSTSITKTINRDNIKSIYITFVNDIYKYSVYARKHSRYNRGIKKITLKEGSFVYPPPRQEEYNSLNTGGPSNAKWFFNELMRTLNVWSGDCCQKFITYKNFCVDYDTSHMFALEQLLTKSDLINKWDLQNLENAKDQITIDKLAYSDRDWSVFYFNLQRQKRLKKIDELEVIGNSNVKSTSLHMFNKYDKPIANYDNFQGNVENITSRCIYALNFEHQPGMSGRIKTTKRFRYEVPWVIEIERVMEYMRNDPWYGIKTQLFKYRIYFERYVTKYLHYKSGILYTSPQY